MRSTLCLLLGVLACLASGACGPDAPASARAGQAAADDLAGTSVPDLERVIQRGSPERRIAAVRALEGKGRAAKEAIPLLVESLKDEDPSLVDAVQSALPALGPADASSLVRLQCALKEHFGAVRIGAAGALAGMGPRAADAAPDLIDLLGETDCSVRTAALHALVKIGSAAVPALLEALVDHPPGLGRPILDTLMRIAPDGPEALGSMGECVLLDLLRADR